MAHIIFGIIILAFAAWCWRKEEVDLLFWFDGGWFDVDKLEHPFLFWIAFISLVLSGLGLIIWGLLSRFFFT